MEKYIEAKLKKIARIYLSSQSHNHPYQIHKHAKNLKHKVERAYSLLAAPLKLIINNDFFYQDYPGWWMDIYPESTYQLLRKIAIYQFMEAYDEIY